MADICETIIEDFLSGALSYQDLEQGLTSIFKASAPSGPRALEYVKKLYVDNRLNDEQFKTLSATISQLNIETTLNGGEGETDISYFNEDKTLHVTGITEDSLLQDNTGDKTVIIRTDSADPVTDFNPHLKKKRVRSSDSQPSGGHDTTGGGSGGTIHANLGPGVTLKGRFVLLERLGQGGMGVVFKAKDLLKVEAQDKNPFVAIKVLTDAFKKFSGSFIALQREASKAQRLAHPNIATVYDFDRDGDTVFMTMEYLQGKPLNRLIKELPEHPISKEKAFDIIEQLCHGLAYAHEKNLIHSDFKPGNCFLLNDGTVKLLDFGIARASTAPGEEKEHTMFDPGKLSAVTPAYATPEMFAGMNPDPRDDIYGLGCVAYQLLAGGKHPYNKVAAPKVKELGIKPKPIKGLDRRQQRTLAKALTVNRDDRIPSVKKFLEGIKPRKSHTRQILLGALFLAIIIGAAGYKPFMAFQEEQSLYTTIEKVKKGDKALLIETIWGLNKLPPEHKRILSVGLRREIITFYRDRINSVFQPDEGRYDYPQANNLLAQAKRLYPDSVLLSIIEDQLKEKKDRLMTRLTALYQRYLKEKRLTPSANGEDLFSVLTLVRRVDPRHYLLRDESLAGLYLSEAEKRITERKFDEARSYIRSGLELFPDNGRLQALDKQINAGMPAR